HLTWSLPGLFLLCSRPWLLTTAAEGGFGTCPCRPVPRGLPSSVKQLRTTQPFGLSCSWRTIVRKPRVLNIGVFPSSRSCNRLFQHAIYLNEVEVAEHWRNYTALRNSLPSGRLQDHL